MAKVLISMKEEFLEEIDRVADSEHRSRSELIREALRLYMRAHPKSIQESQHISQQAQLLESILLD